MRVRQQWMVNNAALCGVCLQLWQQAVIYYYSIQICSNKFELSNNQNKMKDLIIM